MKGTRIQTGATQQYTYSYEQKFLLYLRLLNILEQLAELYGRSISTYEQNILLYLRLLNIFGTAWRVIRYGRRASAQLAGRGFVVPG